MFRIVALNEEYDRGDSVEEGTVSQEVQQTIAESEYVRAITLKSEGKLQNAMLLFHELLQTNALMEILTDSKSTKLLAVRYNCFKNLAIIYESQRNYEMALQNYKLAMQLDDGDLYMMYRFGELALKVNAQELAEFAFENCLRRNPSNKKAAECFLRTLCHRSNMMGSYGWAMKLDKSNSRYELVKKAIAEIQTVFKDHAHFYKKLWPVYLKCSKAPSGIIGRIKSPVFPYASQEITKCLERDCINFKQFRIEFINWLSIGQYIILVYKYLKQTNGNVFFSFSFEDILTDKDNLVEGVSKKNEFAQANIKTLSVISPSLCEDNIQYTESALSSKSSEKNFGIKPQMFEMSMPQVQNQNNQPEINSEESSAQIKLETEMTKSKPRRRCSDLHLLEQWGWHKNRRYSRKKTHPDRTEINTTLNGFLRRKFSKFMEFSFDNFWPFSITDECDTPFNNFLTQCNYCEKFIPLDVFQRETRAEFELFLQSLKLKSFDLALLIYEWLKYVSKFWDVRLSDELVTTYLEVFSLYLEYFNLSTWNQVSNRSFEASYRICILFLELRYTKKFKDHGEATTWKKLFNHLIFNSGCALIAFERNYMVYKMRLVHLEYLWSRYINQLDNCLVCMQHLEQLLSEHPDNFVIHLPNINSACLSKNSVLDIRMELQRKLSLMEIPKLFEDENWFEVVDIIQNNIMHYKDVNENENWARDFKVQIEILLQSLWNIDRYKECLIWAEQFLHFTSCRYLKETNNAYDQKLWAESINFIVSYIEALILNEGCDIVSHLEMMLARLVQNIIRLLCYQLDGTYDKNSNPTHELEIKRPWLILHQILLKKEYQNTSISEKDKTFNSDDDEDPVPGSFLLLFTAHEFLGKRQWCTCDNGVFLHYILDIVTPNLRTPVYDECRDIIYEYIEQVTYCLYGYPQKKPRSRHLEDHDANSVELTWHDSIKLFDLYRPDCLPDFNSYKLESISSDMEQLLLKIITLIPKEIDPTPLTLQIAAFVSGETKIQPDESRHSKVPYKIRNIYYLLADYYFKNRDFSKAINYYMLDLAVNPSHFDSWAGMALSKASKVETKLNGLSSIDLADLLKECEDIIRCFEQCINLNKNHILLWIEYGSFTYTIHSYCSRNLKHRNEQYSVLADKKEEMMNVAYNCFLLASTLQNKSGEHTDENDEYHDEKWLCQFMLGKIIEKRREHPKIYLNYYLMAANYLYESNATYPIKINHSNPTSLSVEALEVFYRINSSILKYLQCNKDVDRATGNLFNNVLTNLSNSPFAYNKAKIDGNSFNAFKRKTVETTDQPLSFKIVKRSENDSVSTSENLAITDKFQMGLPCEDVTKKDTNNLQLNVKDESMTLIANVHPPTRRESQESGVTSTTTTITTSTTSSTTGSDLSSSGSDSESEGLSVGNDLKKCNTNFLYNTDELNSIYETVIRNLEECVTRFPEHYKSIYRLVSHFIKGPSKLCDFKRCEELLLGQYKTTLGNQINGLFYDRKNNNFFNGIWRIPSSEIDRPGSFSAHLVKCVAILLKFLMGIKNHKLLIDIGLQMYRTPDPDKRYIKDSERLTLYKQSVLSCAQIMRNIFHEQKEKQDDTEILNLLVEIYKIYKKIRKYINQKETHFTELIVDVYKFFLQDKVDLIPEDVNFLDLAIKLCLQEICMRKNLEKVNSTGLLNSSNMGEADLGLNLEPIPQGASRPWQIPGLTLRKRGRLPVKLISSIPFANKIEHERTVPISISAPTFSTDMFQRNDLISTISSPQQDTAGIQKLLSDYYKTVYEDCKATTDSIDLSLSLPSETTITPSKILQNVPNIFPKSISKNLCLPPTRPSNSDITITPCDWKQLGSTTSPSNESLLENQLYTSRIYMKPVTNVQNFNIFDSPKLLSTTSTATCYSKSNVQVHDQVNIKLTPKAKNSMKNKQILLKPYDRSELSALNTFTVNNLDSYNQQVNLIATYADFLKRTSLEPGNILPQHLPLSTNSNKNAFASDQLNMNSATESVPFDSISATSKDIATRHSLVSIQSPFALSTLDSITMTALPTAQSKAIFPSIPQPTSTRTQNQAQHQAHHQATDYYPMEICSKTLQQKLIERQKASQLNELKSGSISTPDNGSNPENSNVDVIVLD